MSQPIVSTTQIRNVASKIDLASGGGQPSPDFDAPMTLIDESQLAKLRADNKALLDALKLIADGSAFQQDAEGNCISDAMSVARAALAERSEPQ